MAELARIPSPSCEVSVNIDCMAAEQNSVSTSTTRCTSAKEGRRVGEGVRSGVWEMKGRENRGESERKSVVGGFFTFLLLFFFPIPLSISPSLPLPPSSSSFLFHHSNLSRCRIRWCEVSVNKRERECKNPPLTYRAAALIHPQERLWRR